MRAYNNGTVVAVSEADIRSFCSQWPSSGLRGLKGVTFVFEPNGDLVDIEYKNGTYDQWDGPALTALSEDAQEYGRSRSSKGGGGASAQAHLRSAPKCDQCGGVLPDNKRSRYKSWETGAEFCSERCAERAAEWDEEESRRIQEEMDAEGGGGARARRHPGAHAAHKRSGGGATTSASARRLGLKNYYTLTIPWEPDPKKRTEWHPTDRTGPFKTLQRGAFPTTAAAHAWAKKHLGPGATYSIHRH